MPELSILIPSRNEMFLIRTVQDILVRSEADTEVIVVLDGWQCEIQDSERVKVIRHETPVGQRAGTNEAANLASGKYVMKVDAHCAFDQGFDRKMLEAFAKTGDDVTMVPVMRNLHAFDWVCPAGHRRYQGPSGPCREKGCGQPTRMDIRWIGKENPQSTCYCFDTEPHFQYFNKFKRRPEGRGELTETMSLQGSCFMVTKDRYFDLNLSGEEFGSWGSQGIEVACKSWLSGGRVLCNQRTWYAHMFRTQGGDFGFPYEQSGKQIENAKAKARDLFFTNSWPKQVRPLSWLIDRFKPVPGWHYDEKTVKADKEVLGRVMTAGEEFNRSRAVITAGNSISVKPSVGLVYYSDGHAPDSVLKSCQEQIKACCNGHELVSTTLVPMDFGKNRVMEAESGYLTMFRQILDGIERSTADILFLVEHDVFYHPSHFDFTPPREDMFYYDENVWHIRAGDGHALFYNHMSTSMLCAYRDVLLKHYKLRVQKVEMAGFTRHFGFEPGSHKPPRGCDNYGREPYFAKYPSLDIRHSLNLTSNRWRQDQFRNQKQLYAWTEKKAWDLPGWDRPTLRKVLGNAVPEN